MIPHICVVVLENVIHKFEQMLLNIPIQLEFMELVDMAIGTESVSGHRVVVERIDWGEIVSITSNGEHSPHERLPIRIELSTLKEHGSASANAGIASCSRTIDCLSLIHSGRRRAIP